jgi:peptidoglycan/xylan/chitin deacetylase (PgdA/CDA1 family)
MQKEMKFLALRIDDIGASSKAFEVYSNKLRGCANFLFLKSLPFLKNWGPYRELSVTEWDAILRIIRENGINLTVAITAVWVEEDGKLVPFPDKFPQQASLLKEASRAGLCEIANHGLTHCLEGKHMPRLFTSNRKFHREFYPERAESEVKEHLRLSQDILQNYFQQKIVTLVPPGSVWSEVTERLCPEFGLKIISCGGIGETRNQNGVFLLGEKDTIAFHDRDLVLKGIGFLSSLIKEYLNTELISVKEAVNRIRCSKKYLG